MERQQHVHARPTYALTDYIRRLKDEKVTNFSPIICMFFFLSFLSTYVCQNKSNLTSSLTRRSSKVRSSRLRAFLVYVSKIPRK